MPEVVVFVAVALVVAIIGIRLGMLAAPRLERWLDRDDDAGGER
jgi:ABC-type dipeptide/oligopeptide/nickel transport system permease component